MKPAAIAAGRARELARFYESLPAARVNSWLLEFLPRPPARILDVGSGSGRDAAWLTQAGFAVTAVEPDEAMRAEACIRHRMHGFALSDGRLPGLNLQAGARFAFILANAVWMFVKPHQRDAAVAELAGALNEGGMLALTLRSPVVEERGMHKVDVDELIGDFAQSGLVARQVSESSDLQRPAVAWQCIMLQKKRGPGR